MGSYQDLIVWKEAKTLVVLIYKLTNTFPHKEDFAPTSQMRRASVSVVSQLAEGWLRRSKKDKLRFLEIAEGSLLELETQIIIAQEVGYLTKSEFDELLNQKSKVGFLLYRYKKQIQK